MDSADQAVRHLPWPSAPPFRPPETQAVTTPARRLRQIRRRELPRLHGAIERIQTAVVKNLEHVFPGHDIRAVFQSHRARPVRKS